MTRQIPRDQPLSDEDRAYLHARGQHAEVARLDEAYPADGSDANAEEAVLEGGEERPDWENMTVPQLDAEIDRVNEVYDADLTKDGKKDDKVARLAAWWDKASE